MQTFTSLPDKYRWLTEDEIDEYNTTTGRRWGWQRHIIAVGGCFTSYARPYDCMIEFGMSHNHDPERCEHMMALMDECGPPSDYFNVADEFGNLYYED